MLRALLLTHPEEQNETYLQHARFAAGLGGLMLLAGLAAIIHAVLPFAFKTTASGILARIQTRMKTRGQ